MKEFANVNLSMDATVPRKLAQPYQTEVIHLPKEITCPLKAEYERMNETLEGLKDNINLDGKEIKDLSDDDDAPWRPPSGGQETMVWAMINHHLIPENMKILI